ncbi:MAG TPA: VOC family protein [Anaeromyxobacter sp.]|nr:VOC family protein [Anaeromyxobacter sp.]
MKILGIEHVSINVADMDASVAFYERTLGFERLQTVPERGFAITYFALPGGRRLELFDYRGENPRPPHGETDVGLRHLAFEVEGVAAAERELRAQGVPIVLPTTELPELGVRVLLFDDPNGVTLEFCERLPAADRTGRKS